MGVIQVIQTMNKNNKNKNQERYYYTSMIMNL